MDEKHFNSMDEEERTAMMSRLNEVMLTEFGVVMSDVAEMWSTLTFGIKTKAAFEEIGDTGGVRFFDTMRKFRGQNQTRR